MANQRKLRIALCMLLVLILGLAGVSAQAETPRKKVTVMMYLCGADLERSGAGTATISEMYSTQFNKDEVNVIALCGGTKKWFSGLNSSALSVVDVGKGTRRQLSVTKELPLASMGQPETLTSFLQMCYDEYPADSYDLVMWDHGGGPNRGLCWDEVFDDDQLTPMEMLQAMEASPFKNQGLDLMVMHACLMGSAEFAGLMAPYAKYYVASEDAQYGLKYSFLNGIETRTPLETATRIVDDTYEFNKEVIANQHESETNSFSVTDLSKMQALKDAVNDFFADVLAVPGEKEMIRFSVARRDTQAFGVTESGGASDYDLVDLGDLVSRYSDYAPEKAAAVMEALKGAVVHLRNANDNCNGLTVYYPYANKRCAMKWLQEYPSLNFSESYTAFIERFAEYLTGTARASWKDLETSTPAASKDVRSLFILPLTAEQAEQYGESSLKVLLKGEDGHYTFTYMNRGTSLDQDTITGEFVENAVFAASADGERLSEAVTYYLNQKGSYLIPAVMIKHAGEENDELTHEALISCTYDKDTRTLIPGSVLVRSEAIGAYSASYGLSFADYNEIQLTFTCREETRDGENTLLPFDEWKIADTRTWTGKLDGSWSFAVIPEAFDEADLYATFEVTDCQNNVYSSELLQIGRSSGPAPIFHYDDLETLTLANPAVSFLDDQLMLSFNVTNLTAEERIIALKNLTVNGKALENTAEAYGNGANWGLLENEQQMINLTVPKADLPEGAITEITFDLVSQDAASGEAKMTVPVTVELTLDPSAD